MNDLTQRYKGILSEITDDLEWTVKDLFSGVFLPVPFEAYAEASPKVLFVGRETAGWNTNNHRNTLERIVKANKEGNLDQIIEEAIHRYSWHLKTGPDGEMKRKISSHLKRYYLEVAEGLNLPPEGMIYSNIFAWDYNKKSPNKLPKGIWMQAIRAR
ncbi:hypothetical protein [Neptuniibacter halophilus]|uniref:hypothetical protein n=1 Tax=Neptuniibacter halophilus TaxID=651666 RepID=UPI002574158D|nr:hypothetical protein [Neptuniibacter halophilus]